MALEFCVLASGSKGNSTLIRTGGTRVLLDVGLNLKQTVQRMALVGEQPERIDAVVITHAHSDHVAGAAAFAAKFGTPVYAPYSVAECMARSRPTPGLRAFDGGDFFIKEMTISPFSLPHDVPCYGYSFYCAGSKISFLTDLGTLSENVLSDISDSDAVVIESNHDVDMLRANPRYTERLKARILSTRGHLSNRDCASAVVRLARTGVKQVVLAHLSEQNNDPLVALSAVCDALTGAGMSQGRDVLIDVATQSCVTKLYSIE